MLVPVNLKIRWFLIYALFGLALSVILTFIVTQAATKQLEEQVGSSLGDVAFQLADKLERGMFERYRDMRVSAQLMRSVTASEDRLERFQRLLDSLQSSFPAYAWIGLTDSDGKVLVSTQGLLKGADVSQRPWFTEAQEDYFIGDVHGALLLEKELNPDGDQPLRFVDVAVPLLSPQGEFIGVLGAHLNWDWAFELQESMQRSLQLHESAEILIVSSENAIILGPTNLLEKANPIEISPAMLSGGYGVMGWPDGNKYLMGYAVARDYRDYRGPQWQVMVRQPIDIAYQPIQELRVQAVWIGGAVVIVFGLIGWMTAEKISRPLANINQQLEREVQSRTAELMKSNQRLEQLATTDALTNLGNRRAFFAASNDMCERAQRLGTPLAVVILDLDHFKKVNDTYGHGVGDEVLEAVGSLLRATVRQIDIAARTGGEEFSLLLENTDLDGARQLCDRIRERMEQLQFNSDKDVFTVTMSIGATLWQPDELFETTLERADKALYQAKESGRNRVIVA